MEVSVNYLAVFLAMASTMVVGTVWYTPAVFGKLWQRLIKMDEAKMKQQSAAKPIIITLIVSTITAYVLAHVTYLSHAYFANSFLQDALTTAFWMWLGFTAARVITHDVFEGRPAQLTMLTVGHELVTFMVMGLIIGLMGV